MNVLEFEIDNQILKRIDNQKIINKNENVYKCQFTFDENSEWIDLNKFVIFKDGWGNSSIVHLGNGGDVLYCIIPEKVLRGSYFRLLIYAGELMTTNYITIALIQSGYREKRKYSLCSQKDNRFSGEDIFVEIFENLDKTVDAIDYEDKTLYFYNKDKLLESVYLPFVYEDDLDSLVEHLVNRIVDTELDEHSNKPIANSVVTRALNGKEDMYNIIERIDELVVELIHKGE